MRKIFEDFVLYSPHNENLFKEAETILQANGIVSDKSWNKEINPYNEDPDFKIGAKEKGRSVWYYALEVIDNRYCFHNHSCSGSASDDRYVELKDGSVESQIKELLKAYKL